MVLAEAIAHGSPIISTALPAMQDLLNGSTDSITVKAESVRELKDALITVLTRPHQADTKASALRYSLDGLSKLYAFC